ncbi:hypothetical protein QBC47DRAFT_387034 [Echria macrotheca]|uniref:Fungal N-terminal domain-containing protein n=1 Tax=Echria macrotheca TaxID=438768 RepID=A0AAJ0FA25_9PEZI|nr:hypothetical protein QBC47DRAFT_387034 [Echria macrotheca]
MDPLSAIASIIAVSQALGAGIQVLVAIANASADFTDMLNELHMLQSCMRQFCSVISEAADPRLSLPPEVMMRLETKKYELSQIVGAIDDIGARLSRGGRSTPSERGGEQKVSVISWQRERGKLLKLRNRAKHCREDMTIFLSLLGISEQFSQRKISMDVLAISQNQHDLIQNQYDLIRNLSSRMDGITVRFDGVGMTPPASTSRALPGPSKSCTGQVVETANPLGRHRKGCARYCKCQCHRLAALQTPFWTRKLIGSLKTQYSRGIWRGQGGCDVPACTAQASTSICIAYSFPRWLLGRAILVSASWGSLTNVGASLHLAVPRISELYGWKRAFEEYHPGYFRDKILRRELTPVDISSSGFGYLSFFFDVANSPQAFRIIELLLDLGFSPSFMDPTGDSAILAARRRLTCDPDLLNLPEVRRVFQRIEAGNEDKVQVSTLIRDSILANGTRDELQEALASEPFEVNTVDSLGYAPIHWAARRGSFDACQMLIQAGGSIELRTRSENCTALQIASFSGHSSVVSLLLDNGADAEVKDSSGRSPFHLASSVEIVRILIAAGAKPNATDSDGYNAIHSHAEFEWDPDDYSLVAELVAAGADLDRQDAKGRSPILFASELGNTSAMRHLYSIGATVATLDSFGDNVLDNTAIDHGLRQLECLRTMDLCGIDPDRQRRGSSTVEDFERRMFRPWLDMQSRPTQAEVFTFYALVSDLRQRNWEAGLFLYSKTALAAEGRIQQLREWLGWQWQKLRDDEYFAEWEWDPDIDEYPYQYVPEDDPRDYDTGLLFGQHGEGGNSSEQESTGTTECDESEAEEEFFDALQ